MIADENKDKIGREGPVIEQESEETTTPAHKSGYRTDIASAYALAGMTLATFLNRRLNLGLTEAEELMFGGLLGAAIDYVKFKYLAWRKEASSND